VPFDVFVSSPIEKVVSKFLADKLLRTTGRESAFIVNDADLRFVSGDFRKDTRDKLLDFKAELSMRELLADLKLTLGAEVRLVAQGLFLG